MSPPPLSSLNGHVFAFQMGKLHGLHGKENAMSKQPRMVRNVKLLIDGKTAVAEVLFYFNMKIHNEEKTLALI
ncbi:hypothetical protein EDD22DRAFT_953305 [Suillus occidentalis]|nr:hypothetical protein EDD22DRAFT_953305 [Suillus occidentalis]